MSLRIHIRVIGKLFRMIRGVYKYSSIMIRVRSKRRSMDILRKLP
jgi:hypothetical protein